MTPNNNLSVLPFYYSESEQNARKWWVYGRTYPLFTPAGYILPFQMLIDHVANPNVGFAYLFNYNTGEGISIKTNLQNTGLNFKQFSDFGFDVLYYPGLTAALSSLENGRYYIMIQVNNHEYFSDVFTVVNDIEPYLKIQWWDEQDFIMDGGAIVYSDSFKNTLYLDSDIAKPEYIFEEEGETRDGYFFPIKQISEKRYRFNFLAPEYLLDVLRFVRMSDHVQISKGRYTWPADTFLITPEWQANGDIAVVAAEFETATVAKKIAFGSGGSGPIIRYGDYNNDFNNDFYK